MPNDSPDILGNKLTITDFTNRRPSCKLHKYSVFPTNINEIYGNRVVINLCEKSNDFPIVRYLNPFQNILRAQYFKKCIAIFYLKKSTAL
jgi:hypothetical protein